MSFTRKKRKHPVFNRPAPKPSLKKKRPAFDEVRVPDATHPPRIPPWKLKKISPAKPKIPAILPRSSLPSELLDRVLMYRWQRDSKISESQALAWATRNRRTAERKGLSDKRSPTWFYRWYHYDPYEDHNNGIRPFSNRHSGGCKKFKAEEKEFYLRHFVTLNHKYSTTLKEFCADKPVHATTMGRWLKDRIEEYKAYEIPVVPHNLTITGEVMRLQYAEAMKGRDWRLCSFSDEGYFDLSELPALLRHKLFIWSTQEELPDVATKLRRTKWAIGKVAFTVVVDVNGFHEIIIHKDWKDKEDNGYDSDDDLERDQEPLDMQTIDLSGMDEIRNCVDNKYNFQKRGWRQVRGPYAPKKKKKRMKRVKP